MADIKVWMLTGDKGATAKQIGKTCGIIDDSMTIHQVEEGKDTSTELLKIKNDLTKRSNPSLKGNRVDKIDSHREKLVADEEIEIE